MKNQEIAGIFERMAALLELQGENVFKIRAYQKAAENIHNLSEDIAVLAADGRLDDIPGIGKALHDKIHEYLTTGRITAYEKLTAVIPESLLTVVAIPSLGPKKARLFFERLQITDVAGLKQAAEDGRLLGLPGIQHKTVEKILEGIRLVSQGQARMNLAEADQAADQIITALRQLPAVRQIEVAGSLRRRREDVGDIDILVDSDDPPAVMDAFVHLPAVRTVNAHGPTKSSILTKDDVQVDLRIVDPESLGAALLYFTGSKSFNVRLRQIAMKRQLKVSEYGIFAVQGDQETRIAGRTEAECFQVLGLPFVPPELREELGEGYLFTAGGVRPDVRIPELVETSDIRGDLHVHSTWSDGHNSIAQLAEAARARGYAYLAVSDHSPRLRVASGLSAEDLKKKRAEIDAVNARFPEMRILFGTEVEIDLEGNLDYDARILSEFDVVIAAVHSGLEQDRARMTRRLVKACRNKHVHIIAHPTGVHAGKRAAYDVDLKALCEAAVESNTALEINTCPARLDLNSANSFFAREQGVRIAINTDAHRLEHLDFMRLGVGVARRAWLSKGQVLNTLPLAELLKVLRK